MNKNNEVDKEKCVLMSVDKLVEQFQYKANIEAWCPSTGTTSVKAIKDSQKSKTVGNNKTEKKSSGKQKSAENVEMTSVDKKEEKKRKQS